MSDATHQQILHKIDVNHQQILDAVNDLATTQAQMFEGVSDVLATITDNMVIHQDLAELEARMATKDDIADIEARMATKDDLKAFATKDDLQDFARKDDLKAFATKTDLQDFATKTDLQHLEARLDGRHKANIHHHLETRKAIGDLNLRVGNLREELVQVGFIESKV